jgi:hypothetical protein
MTPDIGGRAKTGAPQSLNRYAYVSGDPTNTNDPTGMDGCSVSGFIRGLTGPSGDFCASPSGPSGDPSDITANFPPDIGGCMVASDGSLSFADGSGCGGSAVRPPPPPPTASAPPNCVQLLTQDIAIYLESYTYKGAPSPLAGEAGLFVTMGLIYNIDPRLIVGIGQQESTLGTSSFAQKYHNAYGIMMTVRKVSMPRPFLTLSASTAYAFYVARQHVAAGQTTVSEFYNGLKNSYCVDQPGFPCQLAVANITKFMALIPNGNPQLVRPADANNLGFPCAF